MTQVAVQEPWTPENWQERHKAIRARLGGGKTVNTAPKPVLRVVSLPPPVAQKPEAPKTCPTAAPVGDEPDPMTDMLGQRSVHVESFSGLTAREIIAYVGNVYRVSTDEICSPGRKANVVRARQVAMYLIRQHTSGWAHSYPRIGQAFGGRDHTTVLHAYRKISAMLASGAIKPLEFDAEIASKICRRRMYVVDVTVSSPHTAQPV